MSKLAWGPPFGRLRQVRIYGIHKYLQHALDSLSNLKARPKPLLSAGGQASAQRRVSQKLLKTIRQLSRISWLEKQP
jgi:hypothetical protein